MDLPASVDMDTIKNGSSGERVMIITGAGKATISEWKSAERIIDIEAHENLLLRIRTFDFPGWKAYMDGRQTKIMTEKGTGAILIRSEPGRHILELRFTDTPVRYYSKIISVASLFVITLLALFYKRTG